VSGQMSRVKSVINNLKELSSKSEPSIQPPARAKPGEMPAPARPPKTSSYNNLISEATTQAQVKTGAGPGPVQEPLVVHGAVSVPVLRTSTPAPGHQPDTADAFPTLTSTSKLRNNSKVVLDNFEYFASGLEQAVVKQQQTVIEERQAKQAKYSHSSANIGAPKMPTFISLRDLPSKPIAQLLLRSRTPSPPPPPSSSGPSSLRTEDDLPPPPSYSTLKRLSTYRRSDRESRREQIERMVLTQEATGAQEVISQERLNMTVTCAEPSSPCRVAARGAAGWQKFLGRSCGRSVSVQLTQEEASVLREKRHVSASVSQHPDIPEPDAADTSDSSHMSTDVTTDAVDVGVDSAPPLPPKPKQKISMIGLPNADNFIVMDNSAMFSKQNSGSKLEVINSSTTTTSTSTSSSSVTSVMTSSEETRVDCHSRSDSGLSSLSSWTQGNSSGTKSGSSSVRSSSIVSDCSSKIEELLDDKNATFLSQCSLKLENLAEQDEPYEKKEVKKENETNEDDDSISITQNHATDEPQKNSENYDYDDVCQSSTVAGVQRQLETIKQQKEILIKDIVQNEELGMSLTRKLEEVMSPKEQEKYNTFLEELEKVVLLVLSIKVRLQKAEEELSCGNLTDWEKESYRYKRDKLVRQFNEASMLKDMSDRRMKNVQTIIEKYLSSDDLGTFKNYIEKKEELLTAQRACEDSEKNILL